MGGDVKMLANVAKAWSQRFQSDTSCTPSAPGAPWDGMWAALFPDRPIRFQVRVTPASFATLLPAAGLRPTWPRAGMRLRRCASVGRQRPPRLAAQGGAALGTDSAPHMELRHIAQGVHLLRRAHIPLAAVDHHNSRIFTPLLADEAVLDELERLSEADSRFAGDDPQSIIRSLMCVPPSERVACDRADACMSAAHTHLSLSTIALNVHSAKAF